MSADLTGVTLFGGGFTLYGYLPALASLNYKNFLVNEKYRCYLSSNKKLNRLSEKCTFLSSDEMISRENSLVVIALNPAKQSTLIDQLINKNRNAVFLLEKPLDVNPRKAIKKAEFLKLNKVNYYCNYIFLYTKWFNNYLKNTEGYSTINIKWSFTAHHFLNKITTWKKITSQGGGVIRFYGIHLIFMASKLGFVYPESSKIFVDGDGNQTRWDCTLNSSKGGFFKISLDTISKKNNFCIFRDSKKIIALEDPFDMDLPKNKDLDRRFELIKKHVKFAKSPLSAPDYTDELRASRLWETIEKITNVH